MYVNLDSPSRRARSELRTQLRETVRLRILDAAEELIAARGVSRAGLAQIAKRAGVAVGTLYNYFTDRDALLRALFDSRRAVVRAQLRAATASGKELAFEPRLRRFVGELLEVCERHRRFLKVAIEAEHARLSPSTTPQDIHAALVEIVEAGVAEKAVARANAALLPVLIAGALKAVILRRAQEDASFVDEADPIVSIFLEGARRR